MLDQKIVTKCCEQCGVPMPHEYITDGKCEWCAKQRGWPGLVDLVLIGSMVIAFVVIAILYSPL